MNKHIGSNFDDFLQEEGLLAEAETSICIAHGSKYLRHIWKFQNPNLRMHRISPVI